VSDCFSSKSAGLTTFICIASRGFWFVLPQPESLLSFNLLVVFLICFAKYHFGIAEYIRRYIINNVKEGKGSLLSSLGFPLEKECCMSAHDLAEMALRIPVLEDEDTHGLTFDEAHDLIMERAADLKKWKENQNRTIRRLERRKSPGKSLRIPR